MTLKQVSCQAPSPYDIWHCEDDQAIEKHLLAMIPAQTEQCVLISDQTVYSLHGKRFSNILINAGIQCSMIEISASELNKDRATKASIEDQLFELGATRHSCLIALGGGVVLDLVNFVAATYFRGIACINIPSSLLAMVDASVGGKSAINLPGGKNLLGCIRSPTAVLIVPSLLKTLPNVQHLNGVAEMAKHALLSGVEMVQDMLERQYDLSKLSELIMAHIQFKASVVEQDPYDHGTRHQLNFGHTVGHAIEACSGYAIDHGDAVAAGMLIELHIANQLGGLSIETLKQAEAFLKAMGLCHPEIIQRYNATELAMMMGSDKKRQSHGQIACVVLYGIGAYKIEQIEESEMGVYIRAAQMRLGN